MLYLIILSYLVRISDILSHYFNLMNRNFDIVPLSKYITIFTLHDYAYFHRIMFS